jgi:hypothetical protein
VRGPRTRRNLLGLGCGCVGSGAAYGRGMLEVMADREENLSALVVGLVCCSVVVAVVVAVSSRPPETDRPRLKNLSSFLLREAMRFFEGVLGEEYWSCSRELLSKRVEEGLALIVCERGDIILDYVEALSTILEKKKKDRGQRRG